MAVALVLLARPLRKRRWLGARAGGKMAMRAQPVVSPPQALGKFVKVPSKHKVEQPKPGDLVAIHYVGMLEDGSVFDSSRERGQPFVFTLGESQVIDGWDVLIGTMALGERADLVIPPEYAYGEVGVPPVIPPNATLTFDVEVMDIGRPVEDGSTEDKQEGAQQDSAPPASSSSSAEREIFWEKDPEREGGSGLGYSWKATGTGAEICITVPLTGEVTAKDIKADVRTQRISLTIGSDLILEGELFAPVDSDDSHWDLERSNRSGAQLLVYLAKIDPVLKWSSLLAGADADVANMGAATNPDAVDPNGVKSIDAEVVDVDVLDVDEALRIANRSVG